MEIDRVLKIEDVSPVEKKLSFEIPWSEVVKEMDRAYRKIGQQAKVKGFRVGKVPRPVLERYYKEETEQETAVSLMNRYFFDALKEKDIQPVNEPSIDQKGIVPDSNFVFTVKLEVEAPLEPKDYEGLDVEKEDWELTEEEIENGMKQLQSMHSTLESISEDRGIEKDDFTLIRFEGKVDGIPRKDMTADHHMVEVGSGTLIPGFEDQLLGMKKNDTREVKVTFPEDYGNKELAGKEALFDVQVKDIRERKLPELNEDFIKNFEKYGSLEELKDELKKTIVERNYNRVREQLRQAIIDQLIEKNDVHVPGTYVERELKFIMTDAMDKLVGSGVPREQAVQVVSNLHKEYEKQAVRMVKASLVIRKIGEKEGIEIDDSDVESRIRQLSERYGRDYETVREPFDKNENLLARLRDELFEQKTMDYIEGKANIRLVKKEKKEEEEKP